MFMKWFKAATVRALRTVAQTAVSLISVGSLMSDVNWMQVLSASLLAGICSYLTSVMGLPEVDDQPAPATFSDDGGDDGK